MGIQVTTYKTQPALDFNKVHLCELRILQPEEQNAKYALRITYKLVAVDAEGNKHFEHEMRSITIDDFEQLAMAKAGEGDMALVNAHLAIQSALAAIIANDGKHGAAQVV
jgi:hypothetical protein